MVISISAVKWFSRKKNTQTHKSGFIQNKMTGNGQIHPRAVKRMYVVLQIYNITGKCESCLRGLTLPNGFLSIYTTAKSASVSPSIFIYSLALFQLSHSHLLACSWVIANCFQTLFTSHRSRPLHSWSWWPPNLSWAHSSATSPEISLDTSQCSSDCLPSFCQNFLKRNFKDRCDDT